jgi:DNA-binding transcriptional regulator YhcF (GntR family)
LISTPINTRVEVAKAAGVSENTIARVLDERYNNLEENDIYRKKRTCFAHLASVKQRPESSTRERLFIVI